MAGPAGGRYKKVEKFSLPWSNPAPAARSPRAAGPPGPVARHAPTPLSSEGRALRRVPLLLALVLVALTLQPASALARDTSTPPEPAKIDAGDTAWMLVSCGLVLLMVPGLALFYGGMVRRKN